MDSLAFCSITLQKKFCFWIRDWIGIIPDGCEIYSIWIIPNKNTIHEFPNCCNLNCFCTPKYFPFIFWLNFIISIMGALRTIREFYKVCYCCGAISTWKTRKYYVLSPSFVRNTRKFCLIVMFALWLLLICGLSMVSPALMEPWLSLTSVTLSIEVLQFFTQMFSKTYKMKFDRLVSLFLPIMQYLFLRCIRNVFYEQINKNDIRGLQLYSAKS